MARKVLIDCDPGIDDSVALTMALFEPRLEIVAVTATGGNVPPPLASRNVQTVLDRLDPPRWPRVGTAARFDDLPAVHALHLHGEDGLGNSGFEVSELHHQHPSEKVICDAVRAHPYELTLVALGPLTNIARAFKRDPDLVSLVDRVVIGGGSVACVGNVTPCAEFNIYADPNAARSVFESATTKTIITLDVTGQLIFDFDFVNQLPSDTTRAGDFLRRVLPYRFRAYRQHLGLESVHLHDAVTMAAVLHPELFETEELPGDVEISGELTVGATIFDRRATTTGRANMEVALGVDVAAVTDCILRCLGAAGRAT